MSGMLRRFEGEKRGQRSQCGGSEGLACDHCGKLWLWLLLSVNGQASFSMVFEIISFLVLWILLIMSLYIQQLNTALVMAGAQCLVAHIVIDFFYKGPDADELQFSLPHLLLSEIYDGLCNLIITRILKVAMYILSRMCLCHDEGREGTAVLGKSIFLAVVCMSLNWRSTCSWSHKSSIRWCTWLRQFKLCRCEVWFDLTK